MERVKVVTGSASATYGSDAVTGVINFIMKKNFEGFQVDSQMGESWHDNNNSYVQGLVRRFGYAPPTGSVKDGRNRTFDMLMETNFADSKGNLVGIACGGFSNSNWFQPTIGANTGNAYSVYQHSFVLNGSVATNPPASFNSQPYMSMTRQVDRYNAAFMAHETVTDSFQSYAEFIFHG